MKSKFAKKKGRFDQEAERILLKTPGAVSVIVIVQSETPDGSGFSVASLNPMSHIKVPAMLSCMASQISNDNINRYVETEWGKA